MTVAVAMFLGAALTGWCAPRWLRALGATRTDPFVLFTAWFMVILGALATIAAGIVLLLVPDHGSTTAVLASIAHCMESLSHGAAPRTEEFAGFVGIALLTILAVRFALIGLRSARRRGRARQAHVAALSVGARSEEGRHLTLWLEHDQPLAFSLAGGRGVIVATEALARQLTPAQVRAVLAHERAHLRGRHHLLIACADTLAAALPGIPLLRAAPAAFRLLAELSADVLAVRACGAGAVRSALVHVSHTTVPPTALAIAGSDVDLRLARLDHPSRRGRLRRAVSFGVATAVAVTLPLSMAVFGLLVMALVSCPTAG
ncbi:M56 family metallopeptidase [Actinokineospora sp.]|uniref:M56 family metallopeptidase n=1 Tax=Actinokineospora sp. TaxID=1872133 RepID=UPI0040384C64